MPISCDSSVLTGSNGSVAITPAGTSVCLQDYSDFPAGNDITVPEGNGFLVGDSVEFKEENGGKLDTGLTAETTYYVVAKGKSTLQVSATKGGSAVTLNGDGGNGAPTGGVVSAIDTSSLPTSGVTYTAATGVDVETDGDGTGCQVDVTVSSGNVTAVSISAGGTGYKVGDKITIKGSDLGATDGTEDLTFDITTASAITGGGNTSGHINLSLDEFMTVCHVSSFSLSLDRGQIETTSLSCDPCSTTNEGLAPFKTYQPGYIDGTGTIEVQFTAGQENASSRLLGSSIKRDQYGARVKLYINTVCKNGEVDDSASGYIEAPVTVLGFSFSVTPDEVTTASVNFALSGQPTAFRL